MKADEQERRPTAGDRVCVDGLVQQIVSATDSELWLCDAACFCKSFVHEHIWRPARAFVWDPGRELFVNIESVRTTEVTEMPDSNPGQDPRRRGVAA